MITEDAARILFNAFASRTDTYASQKEDGSYQRLAVEATWEDAKAHLEGIKTIGFYQLNQENKVKWICFDFDGTNLQEQFEIAKKFYLALKEKKVSCLLEFSGKKGYHIWIFCNEIDAASAKYWAEEISEGYGIHEIFPKQTKIEDGYGNLVKLPLGIHQVSKARSHFFNDDFEALDLHKSIELLEKKINEKETIQKVVIKEIIRTIIKPSERKQMPTYISQLVSRGAKMGERHYNSWVITRELYHCGYTKEETLEQVKIFNSNCESPKPDIIIESHVNYLFAFPEKYLLKETITTQELSDLKKMEKTSYEKVVETYKKWLHLKDEKCLDLSLAVAITRKEKMQPLWIIMIAASGSGKSEMLRPFADDKQPSTTETMSKITPNTFLSGVASEKMHEPDFAETLSGNPKLFLTFDFAQFVKLDSEQKGQIWSQLRDLYDGFIERKACGVSKKVEDIKLNWLICSTPIVDSELLIHQELGTRELIFRFDEEEKKGELMETIWKNSERLEEMRKELKITTRAFIEQIESVGLRKIEISPEIKTELENLALLISVLRAATESDNYTGELTNFVYPEMPTRILLQLKDLFTGLKNLDENYSDEKALQVLKKIAVSSIHPIRLRLIQLLLKEEALTTTQLQKRLEVGYKTVITQLYTASQLKLVKYEELEDSNDLEGEKRWKKKTWSINQENPVIEYLQSFPLN